MNRKSRKKKSRKLWFRVVIATTLIILASIAFKAFDVIMRPNVKLSDEFPGHLYIPTGSDFDDVCNILESQGIVRNINTFRWLAEIKNYVNLVHPGRYKIDDKMSNNQLIDLLRSGVQEEVKIRFQNIRTLEELAGTVAPNLETDSVSILSLLQNDTFIAHYGFRQNEVISMFIPNTYYFNWNTSAEGFFKRMAREYKSFWNENRMAKARKMNLSQTEVVTLASIVQAEQTIRPDERRKVAGLYINRIKKGMKLQSDPTIIYAIGDFTIKRVLTKDRKIESPYNTYMYAGLPPGPINIPDISSIDAVLNYERHDFIFMCAKEDFSGYHNFSKTNEQHQIYAARYHKALDQRKIYR